MDEVECTAYFQNDENLYSEFPDCFPEGREHKSPEDKEKYLCKSDIEPGQ